MRAVVTARNATETVQYLTSGALRAILTDADCVGQERNQFWRGSAIPRFCSAGRLSPGGRTGRLGRGPSRVGRDYAMKQIAAVRYRPNPAPAPKILTRYPNRIAGFFLPKFLAQNPAVEARWKHSARKSMPGGGLDHISGSCALSIASQNRSPIPRMLLPLQRCTIRRGRLIETGVYQPVQEPMQPHLIFAPCKSLRGVRIDVQLIA